MHDERVQADDSGRFPHGGQAADTGDRGDHARVRILVGEFVRAQLTGGRHRADAHGERRGVRLQGRDGVLTDDGDALRGVRRGGEQRPGGALQIRRHLRPGPRQGIVCQRYVLRRSLRLSTNRSGHARSLEQSRSGPFVSSKETALQVKKRLNSWQHPTTTGTPRCARRSTGAGGARTAGRA